ncbi:MAG: kinase/pyrophosphorylase, partial [Deltaproteobacteria bacterium]
MKTVMIISDATGETAERMVRAATLQFTEPVQIRLFSRVRLESELEQILEKAAELKALVVFTVVNQEERDLISKLVERHSIETVDLMGALISKLALYLQAPPAGVPGLLHMITEDYFRRIEAVEFAVKNDDGAEPRNLPK